MAGPASRHPSPVRLGRYLLIEKLATGGMAEVWRARLDGAAGVGRTFVLKRILPHLAADPHFVQMLATEARLSARLHHANIVQIFNLEEADGELFLALEYLEGCDALDLLHALEGSGIPGERRLGLACFVVREVCRALAYAHHVTDEDGTPLHLVHRDLSPSNVMLCRDGMVKLVDFGIAKALGESGDRTATGVRKGKLGYMAPEQLDGTPIDARTDLYGAGILLYELVTGEPLFQGSPVTSRQPLVPPSRLNPSVPAIVDEICLRALERDPAHRFQRAAEMVEALEGVTQQARFDRGELVEVLRTLGLASAPAPDSPPTFPVEAARSAGAPLRGAKEVGLLLVLGVTGALVGWRALSLSPAGHEAPPKRAPPKAAAPERVTVTLLSTPPGATVEAGEKLLGTTPLTFTSPRSTAARVIELRAERYRPLRAEFVPDRDQRLTWALSPDKTEDPIPPARGTRPRPPKPTSAAVLHVRHGGVVDPFAPVSR